MWKPNEILNTVYWLYCSYSLDFKISCKHYENTVFRTLYCAKGNYEFGISRVIKSLDPYSKKLGTDTWFYAKRNFLSLIENMSKHMIMMRDAVVQECIQFLECCERKSEIVILFNRYFFHLFKTLVFLAFHFCRFCSVIRFFHPRHNGQWPPTLKDFYPRFYALHFCPTFILQKETIFPFLMLSAKQGNYWYHFYNVFGMTRSLTGDWTRDLPHVKPALYH